MEPRPPGGKGDKVEHTPWPRWWDYSYQVKPKAPGGTVNEFHWQWHPITSITLDRIWNVEEQLTPDQRLRYGLTLFGDRVPADVFWEMIHISPESRIKALVKVIRGW
jgi:hypothetical protein